MGVRLAKIADLDQILKLLYQLSPLKPEDAEDMEKLNEVLHAMLQDPEYHLVVYEEDGRIHGTAAIAMIKNLSHNGMGFGHIDNVVTDKALRGKGIGKQMVLQLIEIAKQKNAYKVILDCEKYNIPFYEKCGLKQTGEVEMRIDTKSI